MNLNNAIKWLATVITIVGALAVANAWDPLNIYLLNLACVFWIWWAVRIREYSIIIVNVSLLAIYGWGLVVRM